VRPGCGKVAVKVAERKKAKRGAVEPVALSSRLTQMLKATTNLHQSRRFLREAAPAWRTMHWDAKVSCLKECFKHSRFDAQKKKERPSFARTTLSTAAGEEPGVTRAVVLQLLALTTAFMVAPNSSRLDLLLA